MKRPSEQVRAAIVSALNSALAGDGFEGGDFDGEDRTHFEEALEWIEGTTSGKSRRNKLQKDVH